MARKKIPIDRDQLSLMYIDENMTPQKIGEYFGCNVITIRNRLKEFKIPFKDPAFARTRSVRKDFDNNLGHKAYMIGFRIGDLNVYKPSKKSQTIVVRGHTTQLDQVRIIESLFKEFGKVTTSINNGHYHTNCFLNHTFDFLLSKGNDAWSWITKDNDLMAHFIAGYVDAEGNLILNQKKARFKIDSYDVDILTAISKWLTINSMNNRFRRIYKKGDEWNGTFPLNEDLWRLNINDMVSLSKFIGLIMPMARHGKRISDMEKCLSNIEKRLNKRNGHK